MGCIFLVFDKVVNSLGKIENPRTISGFYRIAGKIGVNPPSGCSRPRDVYNSSTNLDTGEAPQSFIVPTFLFEILHEVKVPAIYRNLSLNIP